MNNNELEDIAKNLIKTTELAGKKSIEIQEQGLKITRGTPIRTEQRQSTRGAQ